MAIVAAVDSRVAFGESKQHINWQSSHYRNHKLVGKIWSTATKTHISHDKLLSEVAKARFVLLGETHPNVDHHLLQSQISAHLSKVSKFSPSLVVEMIPDGFGPILKQFRQEHPQETNKLGAALKWQKRGWGKWANYQPIFDVAYRHNLAIYPGNLDRKDIKTIGRKGTSTLPSDKKNWLALDLNYSKAQSQQLSEVLFASHCELVPKSKLSPMALVQQARDGYMASQLLDTPKNAQAVLIAGSGHVRRDWAVPRILKSRQPDSKIIAVSFVEIDPSGLRPQDYQPVSSDKQPVFDYLYFTPKSEIKDHCAALIKMFKKHK